MNKILMAIEDYGIAMLYEAELNDEGYDIVTCSDPLRLRGKISGEAPDLVLLY